MRDEVDGPNNDVKGETKTGRSRGNTRARLFEAAAEVFGEIGVDAASVEMITERAGFTRGAFYSNFESKDDLFFALVSAVSDRKLLAVSERVRSLESEGLRDMAVEELLGRILDVIVDEPVAVRLMNEFRTRAMRDERAAQAYLAWQHGMEERVEGIVGDIARGTGLQLSMQPAELAQMVMFIWEGTSVQAVIERRDQEDLADQVCRRTVAIIAALVASQTTGRG
jgi:AcrR family transcriptional regulator